MPDEVTVAMVASRLQEDDAQAGFLLDGFPRTVAQAQAVDRLLAEKQARVDRVILLEVAEEELVRRLLGRAAKEGRSDDNLESIRERLKVYHDQTAPLVAHYGAQGVMRRVPGMGGVDEIQARVRAAARA